MLLGPCLAAPGEPVLLAAAEPGKSMSMNQPLIN